SRRDHPVRPPKWTTTHGFFLDMGGMAFNTQLLPDNQKFIPGGKEQVSLTWEGLQVLASATPELFPLLEKNSIYDKSKANGLAKALACLQAVWFVVQCIFRLADGISISALELNTFCHAIFALIAYCFWWHKPYDVGEP
ncbi:hypothetical protein QBC41DRAFT_187358, partial [Cercophora samala]